MLGGLTTFFSAIDVKMFEDDDKILPAAMVVFGGVRTATDATLGLRRGTRICLILSLSL